jgi:hypothetical protein
MLMMLLVLRLWLSLPLVLVLPGALRVACTRRQEQALRRVQVLI